MFETAAQFKTKTLAQMTALYNLDTRSGPYFIKVKILLKSGFKMNWSSLSLGKFVKFQFLLTLMQIVFTIS